MLKSSPIFETLQGLYIVKLVQIDGKNESFSGVRKGNPSADARE